MNYIIRKAELKDSVDICTLNSAELKYNYSVQGTIVNLTDIVEDKKQSVFVAVSENTVIGYVHAAEYQLIYAPKFVNILGIAVTEKFRRYGVGTALLGAVEEWAKSIGAEGIRLNSGEERTVAHSFYKKCEYEYSKTQYSFKKKF